MAWNARAPDEGSAPVTVTANRPGLARVTATSKALAPAAGINTVLPPEPSVGSTSAPRPLPGANGAVAWSGSYVRNQRKTPRAAAARTTTTDAMTIAATRTRGILADGEAGSGGGRLDHQRIERPPSRRRPLELSGSVLRRTSAEIAAEEHDGDCFRGE